MMCFDLFFFFFVSKLVMAWNHICTTSSQPRQNKRINIWIKVREVQHSKNKNLLWLMEDKNQFLFNSLAGMSNFSFTGEALNVPQSNHTGLNNTTFPQQTHKALLIIRPKVAVMITCSTAHVKKKKKKPSTSICAVYTKWAQLQEKGQQETKNRHRRFSSGCSVILLSKTKRWPRSGKKQ